MSLGWICLAAACRLAADVVLLRKDTRKYLGAQRDDLLLDLFDSAFEGLLLYRHGRPGFDSVTDHSTP